MVGRIVSERAVGPVLRLPEVSEGDMLRVIHPRAPHREPPRACAQQEPLLDLRVTGAELVDGHIRMARAPVRVLGKGAERSRDGDLRHANVADGARHGFGCRLAVTKGVGPICRRCAVTMPQAGCIRVRRPPTGIIRDGSSVNAGRPERIDRPETVFESAGRPKYE
jgi:hypothetical protein